MEVNLGWMQNPDWIFEKMDRKSAENHFNQKKIGKNMNWAESGSMAARGIGIEPSNWAESGTMAANVLIPAAYQCSAVKLLLSQK